jgi:hypothetical protein
MDMTREKATGAATLQKRLMRVTMALAPVTTTTTIVTIIVTIVPWEHI